MLIRKPIEGLQSVIEATSPDSKEYLLSINNTGARPLRGLRIIWGDLLHPGQFGLDDTHMPGDIWVQTALQLAALGAGESVRFRVTGYDVPDRYDGPRDTALAVDAFDTASGEELRGRAVAQVRLPRARSNQYRPVLPDMEAFRLRKEKEVRRLLIAALVLLVLIVAFGLKIGAR